MIQGFQITEKLHETRRSVTYRAIRTADRCCVVLKMLNSQYPTPRGLARYRQEYELIRSLSLPGVIQAHGLEKLGNTVAIVLEDFGGSALSLCFERQRPTIEQLLELAIQITAALGQIHQQGIIHKDINPSNILWNERSGQLKIIDFGIATRLSNESPTLEDPGLLEGTLPYVSPEQTGRMNRRLDYRTDFYSLGVTLYELLTGQLPFDRADALELLHCHIAAQPRSPAHLRDDAPPILSEIISKLLAKTAEDRYQSAAGLAADLEQCLAQVRSGQEPAMFPLGRQDFSHRFAVPQKLYGRAAETAALLGAFERIARGRSECVLVAGNSGIGKSSLVRELYKPITQKRAFFVSGKFDLLQRGTAYSAFVAACSELVKQLLTRSKAELLRWQEQLLAALGPNGRVLLDLVPELELVIGAQPPVEELDPTKTQNRTLLAFASFLRVFCKPAHPLVVFLDDLQWADPATLRLLESLLASRDTSHFLFIGAYRDSEVDALHPLATSLQRIASQDAAIHSIRLHPLGPEDMAQMLADALHLSPAAVRSLAELVLRRTGGNPFFINELLETLHEENLLIFDPARPGWRWDMAGIEAIPVTDSVVDLLSPKLSRFAAETQTLLRLAACIGNRFDLDTIAMVSSRAPAETALALMTPVREGYILPAGEAEVIETESREPQLLVREYRFAHDRVQQAAYALISVDDRTAIHLAIGHRLLTRLGAEERERRLFEIVDHLDLGRPLLHTLSDAVTPVELARLNLAAGVRARQAAAYAAAVRYLAIGLELAGQAWDEHGELALSLHIEGAMAEYCHADYARSQALIHAALRQATSVLVKARLYRMLLVQYTNQNGYEEAFRVAREALALLGQPFPQEHELGAAVQQELARNQQLLGDRPIESLIDAPEMVDDTYKAAIEILGDLKTTAYGANREMHSYLSLRMVNLTLEHGHTPAGVQGYTGYAVGLSTRFGDYQRGYRFGVLALRLAERFRSTVEKCKAETSLSGTIMLWVRPIEDFYPSNLAAFEAALQVGELQFATFNLAMRQQVHLHHGTDLARVIDESAAAIRFSERHVNARTTRAIVPIFMAAAHLRGDRGHADIPALDADAEFVATCRQQASLTSLGFYYAVKCQALYLDQEYERALEAASEAEQLRGHCAGMLSLVDLALYHSLCLTALYPGRSPAQQEADWRRLEAYQAQLQSWADGCPENFRHKQLMVAAEMARVAGDVLGAMDRYLQAIAAAERNGFRQDVALTNELAARLFLGRGQTRYAMSHLRDAHYGYELWGAKRKAAMLEAQHPGLLMHAWKDDAPPGDSRKTTRQRAASSTTSTSEQLDLGSVIKASQALSSEISLDRLLARLIEIVIESAGAQHGYLILRHRDRLAIAARGTLGAGDVEVLASQPLEESGQGPSLVATAIVHYVLRSRETVVLHDAVHEGPFVADPHVVATRPRSILCMPLLNQGNVSGVVYMENNLSPQAFTPARVELLALLSSQMAISLDNSLLYGNLQRSTHDLERLLNSIAHDLKEPLRAVHSFAELLTRRHGSRLDDQGRDYLARIFQAGQRLHDLLEAIRVLSKIRHIQGPHQMVPGERLVQGVLKRLRPLILQARATVRVSGELPRLAVEQRWAAEALYQLVHNGLTYTRDGLAPEIDIEPYDGSEGAGFVVKDRGPGIAAEHAEELFELFRRAVGREIPGTGAGLAIVRQVAIRHGGNAWLRPRMGGGTEVYITFG